MLTASSKSAQSAREIVVTEIARLRDEYAAKRAEYLAVANEVSAARQAQPSRDDLQRVLEKAINKLCNNGLRQLLPAVAPYIAARDENEQRAVDVIYDLFTQHKPHESGLFALLRPALLAGCADAAERLSPAIAADRSTVSDVLLNWPDGSLSDEERAAKIAKLEPVAAKRLEELFALEKQMVELGISVEKPTL